MFCSPCKAAMVTRLTHSFETDFDKVRRMSSEERRKSILCPTYKVTSTCTECGAKEDVGRIQ